MRAFNPPAVMAAPAIRRKNSLMDWLGQRISMKTNGFWGSFFGAESWAGEQVTPARAMQLSAVWSGIRLTSTTVAALPKGIFADTPDGPQAQPGGPSDGLLSVPNDEQTPIEFWEQMVGSMELEGNGICQKFKIGARVVALGPPWLPARTDVRRNVQGSLEFRYRDDRGREIGPLSIDDVFLLKGFSLNGPLGMSTVRYGAQTMGLAIAAEKTAGKLFKSGMRNSGFLNTGQVLEEPDRDRLQKIIDQYVGSDKAGGLMLLEGGMTFTGISMSGQDAELLLTRKFEIEELGRWLGMPPILLGHAVDGQTMWGSGVDSIIQAWETLGLTQRLVRIEQAWDRRVLTAAERAKFYLNINEDALMRVNSPARIAFLATAVQNGLMDRNEGRRKMDLGKRPGGDVLTAQVNLVPLDQLGQSSADATAAAALKAAGRRFLGIEDPAPNEDHPKP